MSYITRTMEPLVSSVASEYSAVLVTGPRQVGKSTMLGHITIKGFAHRDSDAR